MARVSAKIRRLLVDGGLVGAEDWEAASKGGAQVLEGLVAKGLLKEQQLFEVLGRSANIPPVDLTRMRPEPEAVGVLVEQVCLDQCVLPLTRRGDVLTIAVSDPFDVLLLDDLNILTGCKVKPVLSHPAAIRTAIENFFKAGQKHVDEILDQVNTASAGIDIKVEEQADDLDLGSVADGEDAPAIKLINLILLKALRDKASDIHIEPMDKDVRVRLRIDGRMLEAMRPPRSLLAALTSRLKIMASLDIAERQVPQDGKFQIRYEGRSIDFRLSTLPVVGGEKAVMRILDQSGAAHKLAGLGYEPKCLADMQLACASSYGMMLVTGPTGSGKSTTLYAAVGEVASPEINVVTVEDPVEYRMEGINQVPVNPKRGLTFAGALRSILRQDPDVVLVGEIRDKETAEIAVKAALTGHMVLSTLHTNDAPGAITRLIDMGIDPFMVSSSVVCIAAQRLARKLCDHCKTPLDLPRKELLDVGVFESELETAKLCSPHPSGCPRCKNGYKGRFAFLETLLLDAKLKRMIVEGRSVHELKTEAISQGMLTLRRVGLLNAMRGKTSLEEVLRLTASDK